MPAKTKVQTETIPKRSLELKIELLTQQVANMAGELAQVKQLLKTMRDQQAVMSAHRSGM